MLKDIDIMGATSPEVEGSPVEKNRWEKISNNFPDIRFYLSTWKREERPQCIVGGEVLADSSFNARNLHRHLITAKQSLMELSCDNISQDQV